MFVGLFENMVSSIARWPWNYYLTEDDFDLTILLPQTPRFSDYRYEKPHSVYGAGDPTKGMLGKPVDGQVSHMK